MCKSGNYSSLVVCLDLLPLITAQMLNNAVQAGTNKISMIQLMDFAEVLCSKVMASFT